jgi:hypothetical protein
MTPEKLVEALEKGKIIKQAALLGSSGASAAASCVAQ